MSGIHKRRGRVLIEFTEDTVDELDGSPKRRIGEQVWVDPASAKSFVDIKGVAKRVEDEPEVVDAELVDAADEDQELGAVVHVAEDGTETPSVPDADGVHTLEATADEKPAKQRAAKPAGKQATETPVTDAPPVGDA